MLASVLGVNLILVSRSDFCVRVTCRPGAGNTRPYRRRANRPNLPGVVGSSIRFAMGCGGGGMSLANGALRRVLFTNLVPEATDTELPTHIARRARLRDWPWD